MVKKSQQTNQWAIVLMSRDLQLIIAPWIWADNNQLNRAMPNRDDVVVGGVSQTGSGSKLVAIRRFTGVLIDDARALFTGDMTAPAKATVTFLHPFDAACVVAPPTTHDVTSVRAQRRLTTASSGRPQRTYTHTHTHTHSTFRMRCSASYKPTCNTDSSP